MKSCFVAFFTLFMRFYSCVWHYFWFFTYTSIIYKLPFITLTNIHFLVPDTCQEKVLRASKILLLCVQDNISGKRKYNLFLLSLLIKIFIRLHFILPTCIKSLNYASRCRIILTLRLRIVFNAFPLKLLPILILTFTNVY